MTRYCCVMGSFCSCMLMALLSVPHRSGISFGLTVRVKEEPGAQAVQAVATAAAAAAAMQGDVERARFLQVKHVCVHAEM